MEYEDPNWDPPSRWDDGILGAFIDYNATGRVVKKKRVTKEQIQVSQRQEQWEQILALGVLEVIGKRKRPIK